MDIEQYVDEIPYWDLLGMELQEVSEGRAVVTLEADHAHSSNDAQFITHGGVISSLVDSAGGTAALSVSDSITPTIDLRVDYLAPATTDMRAEAEVLRNGESTAVVSCDVFDETDTHVATARAVYKTSGGGSETPWSREH